MCSVLYSNSLQSTARFSSPNVFIKGLFRYQDRSSRSLLISSFQDSPALQDFPFCNYLEVPIWIISVANTPFFQSCQRPYLPHSCDFMVSPFLIKSNPRIINLDSHQFHFSSTIENSLHHHLDNSILVFIWYVFDPPYWIKALQFISSPSNLFKRSYIIHSSYWLYNRFNMNSRSYTSFATTTSPTAKLSEKHISCLLELLSPYSGTSSFWAINRDTSWTAMDRFCNPI